MSQKKGKALKYILLLNGAGFLAAIIGLILIVMLLLVAITSAVSSDQESKQESSNKGNQGVIDDEVKYADIINKKADKYDVSPALLAGIIKQESQFNKNAGSDAGAMGLMQIMPENCEGHGYSTSDCKKPKNNIDIGAKMISGHLKDYDDDEKLALAAYNAGVGNVEKHDGIPPFDETEEYVEKIPKYEKEYEKKVKDGKIKDDGGDYDSPDDFVFPVDGGQDDITSPFGTRWGDKHEGIDIGKELGTDIHASKDGKVELTKANPGGYGYYVDIKHKGGWVTRYGHMYKKTVKVNEGDKIKQGDKIAEIGNNGHSTGPHLHFEIQNPDGKPIDPEKEVKDLD